MADHEDDQKENAKTEAQSPERTDAGIYAGVEKYAKEDHPQHNVAYDPATGQQTGAGVPPTTGELFHRSETNDGKSTLRQPIRSDAGAHHRAGGEPQSTGVQSSLEPDEVTRLALHPAPAPTREHLIENYPHVFPRLEQQAAEEAKRKEEEEEKEAREQSKQDKVRSLQSTNQSPSITG